MGLSLESARTAFRSKLEDGAPVECPCCRRTGRIYHRRLNAGMARVLVRFYHVEIESPGRWVHIHEVFGGLGQKHRDWPLLRLWGLLGRRTKHTKDEPSRGFWRLTERGRAFVEGRTRVPRFVFVFDGERTAKSDEMTTIEEALGKRFVYSEIMNPRFAAHSPPG